jgi:hypothetical protein
MGEKKLKVEKKLKMEILKSKFGHVSFPYFSIFFGILVLFWIFPLFFHFTPFFSSITLPVAIPLPLPQPPPPPPLPTTFRDASQAPLRRR